MFPKKGNKLHPRSPGDGTGTGFNGVIAAALKEELGSTHRAIKTVVRWTGAGERTVKYWFAGSHGPSGEHLVALVRNSDAVFHAFTIMVNRGDPLLAIKLTELRERLLELAEVIGRQA